MKRSIIGISTFREIKQSLGRFLAIFAIAALGVGFFAGLKITKTAMLLTVDEYFDEVQFYDYRLLSTLGFEEEDAVFFRQQENVRAAEGAISFDILCADEENNESVLKAHSLTTDVNRIDLLEGRMPENGAECLADSKLFDASDIGTKIYLAQDNEEEDLDHFAYREYTITGLVRSPLYIQFERGNSSLGAGRVSGFFYLLPEGFDTDYYTEIYVKFDADFALYDEAYDEFLEETEASWADYAAQAADRRFEEIRSEGEEELADAESTFEEEKAKGQRELVDALAELKDAYNQITEGEEQLEDARKELEEAEQTIAEKETELSKAEQTIAEKEAELLEGEQTLSDQIQELEDAEKELAEGKNALEKALEELAGQSAALEEQEAELLQGEAKLQDAEAELRLQQQLLAEQAAALDGMEAAYPENMIPEDTAAQIAAGRAEITEASAQLEAGWIEIEAQRQALEEGKTAAAEGRARIEAYRTELDNRQEELDAAEAALAAGREQVQRAQEEISEGKAALEAAKNELTEGRKQLAEAKKTLEEGQQTLADKEAELADAKLAYEDGQREYEEGLKEFQQQIADAETELADARQELEELSGPDTYVLGRDTNVGYVCFESDSSIVDGIANVFPVFFFLVAALICMTTMNRMVEEQRTQIGVLKALGYGERTIMSKYMVYSGTAAVSGCIFGFFIGTWLFPKVIWECYRIMYVLEDIRYVFDWKLALISLLVSVFCSMGVTWLCCRRELHLVAAELMRPKVPKAGKRVFLEYVPFIWKRLSFLRKVSVRNIFRYKKRLFMMAIGIGGCTALLITGFGVRESVVHIADRQFNEIQIYDLNISLSEQIDDDLLNDIRESTGGNWEETLCVMETTMDLVTDNGRKSISLVAVDPGEDLSPFLNLHNTRGEDLSYPGKGEVILTHKIAENLGIKVGDTIQLQSDDMETLTLQVSGISQNFIYNYAYIGSDTYREQMGREPVYKTLYVNCGEGTDVHLASAAFMKLDEVRSVTVNEDTRERISGMMQSMDLIVVVIILCAAGLAAIVLYNLTNINITERIREIATIKVLGFYKRETAAYVFRENMLLTVFGMLLGLWLGHYLHLFVMSQIRIDMVAFDVQVGIWGYLYSMILTLLFAFLVNSFMQIKLEGISMTESLKSVD